MSEDKTPAPPANHENGASKKTAPKWIIPAMIALGVLLYFGIGYVVEVMTHESTDDAFIAGHVVSIAPRISGQVVAVHVLDNQMVHANDLLVEIDPSDYAMVVAEKQTAAVSQQANLKTMLAAYELMRAKVTTAEATARKSQADADSSEATAKKTQADFERAENLLKQNTVSQQEYDSAKAANTSAQSEFKSAQGTVEENNSKVDEAQKQCEATLAEKDVVFAQVTEALTNVAAAQLNFSYAKIYAPGDGLVTRKSVEAGDYLQAGQQIMSIVPKDVWVVANFKESQLKDMHTNQPAVVAIDALGGREFRAHVESVQAGSGAQFSLLPPENATGNFVKVIQRVPVKLVFDEPLPADHVIGPGLSVTPSVEVGGYVMPAWMRAGLAVILASITGFILMAAAGRKSNSN